ncbi:hypothetical protein [Litoreibacter roseus]|nr:hypothetical protein [Litoreibacter roseus]
MRYFLILSVVLFTGCREEDTDCVLPSPVGEWPEFMQTSAGADIPDTMRLLEDVSRGMTPQQACDTLVDFGIGGFDAHKFRMGDAAAWEAIKSMVMVGMATPRGFDDAVEARVAMRFSQLASGAALEQTNIVYNFVEEDTRLNLGAIERNLVAAFGPYSHFEETSFGRGASFTWVIDDGQVVLKNAKAACTPVEFVGIDQSDAFDMKNLSPMCDAILKVEAGLNFDQEDRPVTIFVTLTDNVRTFENRKIDRAAINDLLSTRD